MRMYSTIGFAMLLAACMGTQTQAADLANVCGQPVDHVLMEQGKITPPIHLLPDVGGDFDNNAQQQEWTYLGSVEDAITVHCFTGAGNKSPKTDVELPKGVQRCVLGADNIMACSS